MISSTHVAIPDPTSVLSTTGHHRHTMRTRLSSNHYGTTSTAQLGSKATSGQPQDQITIFPWALLALDGPEQPHLGPTSPPMGQEFI